MTLQDILKFKGTKVFSTYPDATLQEAVHELVRHRIGALLVCDRDTECGEKVRGIITERDILYACGAGKPLGATFVEEIMTRDLRTAKPTDSIEDAMEIMTHSRVRHLPILANDRLVGIVSIGDVVKVQHDRLAMENQFMKDYIRS
jgi:CBS domain-containing protein